MNTTRPIRPAALFLAAALVAGSAFARKPAPQLVYPFSEAQTISIAPVVDARSGDRGKLDLESLRKNAIKGLQHRGYRVSGGPPTEGLAGMNADDLKEAAPDLVRRLGAPQDRWVMILCINDVSSKMTFGSTGNAEMTGILFDKQSGKVAWTNKGIGQAGQGGLMGMAMKGMMKEEALSAAIAQLLASFPKQPKGAR